MAYVWSSSTYVTVQSVPALSISRVWIDVSKNVVNVGEKISISVWAELNRAVQTGEKGSIEFALAIDSTSNIVRRETVDLSAGAVRHVHTFVHSFDKPGTYRIYGGARLVLPTGYTPIEWRSRDIVVGYPEPSPDITNLLMFVTGAIIGIEAYKKWQEVKGRLPRIAIVRR